MVTAEQTTAGYQAAARRLRGLAVAAALAGLGTWAIADNTPPLDGLLRCDASVAGGTALIIELDARIPIAVVDDEDRPATYSESHVRIRLAPEGPTLTIGRSSGRFLAVDASGQVINNGRCTQEIGATGRVAA